MSPKASIFLYFTLSIFPCVLCGNVVNSSQGIPPALPLPQSPLSPHSDSPSISLQLYPLLGKTAYKDQEFLMRARLRDDAARASSIDTAVMRMKEVGDIPVFSAYPLYNGKSVQYVTEVGIGEPSQLFNMILDTGSTVSWVYSDICNSCGDDVFSPENSSTLRPVLCDAKECIEYIENGGGCFHRYCFCNLVYGDNTAVSVIMTFERLAFRNLNSFQKTVINNILIGVVITTNEKKPSTPGLLGLSRGKLSMVEQLNAQSFAFCLVEHNSREFSTLDFNYKMPNDSITIRLHDDKTFYYVMVTTISVNGKQVPMFDKIKIMIDSGTVVGRLPPQLYQQFRDSFRNSPGLPKNRIEWELFDTCYPIPRGENQIFPTVWFHFGDQKLRLHQQNYLVEVRRTPSTILFCLAFMETNTTPIFGNTQLLKWRVTFDLSKSLVGFKAKGC